MCRLLWTKRSLRLVTRSIPIWLDCREREPCLWADSQENAVKQEVGNHEATVDQTTWRVTEACLTLRKWLSDICCVTSLFFPIKVTMRQNWGVLDVEQVITRISDELCSSHNFHKMKKLELTYASLSKYEQKSSYERCATLPWRSCFSLQTPNKTHCWYSRNWFGWHSLC